MATICGADCGGCAFKAKCKGCGETCGHPWGGSCVAAEYIKTGGKEAYEAFKAQLIRELNGMRPEGTPELTALVELCGFFVNLAYPLPGGQTATFLDDKNVYLGAQQELPTGRCLGYVAGMGFLLICEYGEGGKDPELVAYKRR